MVFQRSETEAPSVVAEPAVAVRRNEETIFGMARRASERSGEGEEDNEWWEGQRGVRRGSLESTTSSHGDEAREDKGARDCNPMPPELKGSSPEEVRRWFRKVEMWRLDTKCPEEKMGLRVAQRLAASEAVEIAETIEVDDLAKDGGLDLLLAALEEGLKYDEEDEYSRGCDDLLEFQGRTSGQRMAGYIAEMNSRFIRAEKHLGAFPVKCHAVSPRPAPHRRPRVALGEPRTPSQVNSLQARETNTDFA